jgi:hypothetical protein
VHGSMQNLLDLCFTASSPLTFVLCAGYCRRPNPAIQQQHQRSPVQDYPLQIPSR